MASIQKRGKTYQYTISRMVDGKPQPIRKGGFHTKKEATIAAAEMEAMLNKGVIPFLKPAPFDEYFENWVKLYKSNLAKATLKHYSYTYDRIKEFFYNTPLQEISTQDYQKFLNQLGANRSKETVEKVNGHIRACVLDAVDEQIIPRDFTRKGELKYTVDAKEESEKYLNYNDSILLLNRLKKQLDKGLEYYLLLLGLTSGVRFEELVGLIFSDFDFDNNEIYIDKTWGYNSRMPMGFGPLKNKASKRKIKLEKTTMELFKNLFKTIPDNEHHLVFYNEKSIYKVITNERANDALKEILLELNIRPLVTMHGLRHTHGSILLHKKASYQYVSRRLGHKDIQTTLRVYAHLLKETLEENDQIALETFTEMYDE
ncbi:tyrosine-type recombinase/integrase [Lysinibacillus sp. SGAir0095]|uniref:tyrosine-type recombinase/integrase n=1 Tax=Lysinibacillus sp. SGAir0095 TaxID=2070463 RepID=UPI0010CD31A0|nr:tyrosine-type recombinase/integrase [Lysinibacillus sp. SGAir0095]QCR33735.1 integrase [Lysinibacillus sp. SGAir0095]